MGVTATNVKLGRNKIKCSNYFLMSKRITNKRRKLTKHISNNENDFDAKNSLKQLNKKW